MFFTHHVTYRDVLYQLQGRYDEGIKTGEFTAFVYPQVALPSIFVLAYLLIPHTQSPFLRSLRWLVWTVVAATSFYMMRYCKARGMAASYAVGLINCWAALWCATILLVHDCQSDFQRIERTEGDATKVYAGKKAHQLDNGTVKETKDANGTGPNVTDLGQSKVQPAEDLGVTKGPRSRKGKFAWQPYPLTPFIERLDWVSDIYCNFRGMGWNWQIVGPPPIPQFVQRELRETSGTEVSEKDTHVGRNGTQRYHTQGDLLWTKARTFLIGYAWFDILKTIMIHDPYFWGFIDAPPPQYLPTFMQNSPVLMRSYRLLITQGAVITAMCTVFAMGPLFFAGIWGPKLLGVRGEPWMYPDTYGSYRMVFDHGLAGWWGGWWHQTFRFAFEAPSKKLIDALGINQKSTMAKAIQLILAFTLSGMIHASGSHTMIGKTNPLSGPFLFFNLQTLGIMAQIQLSSMLKKAGVTQKVPKLVRQIVNFVYVHVWFYYTAPLLTDDFAKGGLWMIEPIPISILRPLGFGIEGDSWWCWGYSWRDWIHWHQGKHWWQSGIAL